MSKTSKKELKKPDAFQVAVVKILDYIQENKTRFYVSATAIIAALAVALGIYLYWNHYQTQAMKIYSRAQDHLTQALYDQTVSDKTMKTLQELIDKYPHSWSARMAHYHLGNVYYKKGDLDNAIDHYKKFVSVMKSDEAGIRFLALSSLGYCYEARQDYKTALEYFEKARKTKNIGFESMAYRNIARMYELMGDKKKALENYKSALQRNIDPSMDLFIKRKISALS